MWKIIATLGCLLKFVLYDFFKMQFCDVTQSVMRLCYQIHSKQDKLLLLSESWWQSIKGPKQVYSQVYDFMVGLI